MTLPDWSEARAAVCATARRAAAEGLVVGTAGNISQTVGDLVAITATGAVFADITEAEVVLVDRQGVLLAGDLAPTSEVELHLLAYATTGAGAVVHTHAPISTAFGVVFDSLPVVHYQQLLLGGEIRVAPYATFGSPELAQGVAQALKDRQAALMANHGSVAVGSTPQAALERCLLLEWLCQVYRDACVFGDPKVLSAEQQEAVILAALAKGYGSTQSAKPQENKDS